MDPDEAAGEFGNTGITIGKSCTVGQLQQTIRYPVTVLDRAYPYATELAIAGHAFAPACLCHAREKFSQSDRVLDGRVGALAMMRKHRVGSAPKEDHAAAIPASRLVDHKEAPARPLLFRPTGMDQEVT